MFNKKKGDGNHCLTKWFKNEWRFKKKKTGLFKKRDVPKKKNKKKQLIWKQMIQKWMKFFHNLKGYEKDKGKKKLSFIRKDSVV